MNDKSSGIVLLFGETIGIKELAKEGNITDLQGVKEFGTVLERAINKKRD